jgi:hypothetical protein
MSCAGGLVVLSVAGLFAQAQPLKIGTGTSVVTPFLEQSMAGYYYPRSAEGVHDDLYAKAMVFDDGRDQMVWVACDTIHVTRLAVEEAKRRIQQQLGIPAGHVLISATHSHTGPEFTPDYVAMIGHRIADAVVTAHGRMGAARLFVAIEQESSLPHYRRYLMKDGSVVTNPGFLNPSIVKPMGEIDPRVPVLYAEDGRGAPLATWVNYSMHLDTVGGSWISADYAYYLGRMLAKLKGPDMLTVFTIGAAGNINHWDVRRPGPQRGYGEAERLGEVLGAAVAKAYTHIEPVEPPRIHALSGIVHLSTQEVTPDDVAQAKKVLAVPPEQGVDFTLERVKATRVMDIVNRKGEDLAAEVQVLSIGPVAIVGVPGEFFVELGNEIQRKSPFANTFIVALANDNIGYIPTRAAFAQGAYEPTSAMMAPGGGERLVAKAVEMLQGLKRQ